MSRFARRAASGYYVPLLNLVSYGIGLRDGFNDSNKWFFVSITPNPFVIISDTTIDCRDNHPGIGIRYWQAVNILTDQYAEIEFDSSSFNTIYGPPNDIFFVDEAGIVVRHTGTTWPSISGYSLVWAADSSGGPTVWTWKTYRYSQTGLSTARQLLMSGALSTPAAGDLMRLEVTGSGAGNTLVAKLNGSTLGTFVDSTLIVSTYDSGRPGVSGAWVSQNGGSAIRLKNWRAGALNVTIPLTPAHRRGTGYYLGNQ